jgi:exopolysaccharide biosynthesis protein
VDRAPADAALALNAGQFGAAGAWGWVVRGGVERQAPGRGPLAPAVVIGRDGSFRIIPADSIAVERASGRVVEAFQSYPALLDGDGVVPAPIRTAGNGVDLEHRDSRLAIGELRDGRLLVALTRFEGLGGVLDNLPFGLTTPEMAAVMGALGARRAVLLDGGISSQMLLRAGDETHAWRGIRYVPLGLIATSRNEHAAGRTNRR